MFSLGDNFPTSLLFEPQGKVNSFFFKTEEVFSIKKRLRAKPGHTRTEKM
ncbi:hypothetical protein CEXT_158821, partial [Caerostris extrusa]